MLAGASREGAHEHAHAGATSAVITARVFSSAAKKCSTLSEAAVMSCGAPTVVNIEKNANSPCAAVNRVLRTGWAGCCARLGVEALETRFAADGIHGEDGNRPAA